jgi:hypothetical protein
MNANSERPISTATTRLLARRAMGVALQGQYIMWALSELQSGTDTKNVRILAGLSAQSLWSEIDFYFLRALDDLGVCLPEPKVYLQQYLFQLAEQIVSGTMPALEGCCEIEEIWRALDYPAHLNNWSYLTVCIDPDMERDEAELKAEIRREAEALLASQRPE